MFEALPENEHLEVLSLTNVGLTDRTALLLAEAIEKSKTLRVLNVETNFISPPVVVRLVNALLKCRTVEEFRASNQVKIWGGGEKKIQKNYNFLIFFCFIVFIII